MNRLCDVFEDRGVFDRCRIFGVDEAASDEPQRRLIEGNEEPLEEGDDGQAEEHRAPGTTTSPRSSSCSEKEQMNPFGWGKIGVIRAFSGLEVPSGCSTGASACM